MIKKYLIQYKHLVKEGGWVFFGQASVAVISLIGLRILTEIAPSNLLGAATLLIGIMSLLKNIFISPIGNTQIRFHSEYLDLGFGKWFDDKIKHLYIQFILVAVLAFTTIFCVWSYYNSFVLNFLLLFVSILYFILDSVKGYKINRMNAERRQKFVAIWQIVDTLLVNTFFIIALLLVNDVESYLAGQSFGLLLSLIIFGFIIFPKIENKKNEMPDYSKMKQKIIDYGLPFVPLAFVAWITNLSDRYIIGNFLSLYEVGIYTAVYSISSRPFILVNGILTNFFRPILFQEESRNDSQKAKRTFKTWIVASLIIFISFIILYIFGGNIIIRILLAKAYTNNTYFIFLIIGIAYAITSLNQILENRTFSFSNSKIIIVPNVISAIVNLSANFLLIPIYGLEGAAFATLISFLIQFILTGLILRYRF